jgi:hypothetical protein
MLDIQKEIAALAGMTAGELARRYGELFGEATRCRNRAYLVRKIAWKLQTLAEGDLSERARRRAEELAQGTPLRVMSPKRPSAQLVETLTAESPRVDPRLPPPGSTIVRQYRGRVIRVLVLTEGFELEGQRYASLSAVAKAITGSHVSGYRFFGLGGKR